MRKEKNYREMIGSVFWALIPFGVICLMWASNRDSPMYAQNFVLGLVGAAIGASAFIYGGYVFRPPIANAQTQNQVPGMPSSIINNQEIVTQGQSGGRNTVINQGPQPRKLSNQQQDIISQELKKNQGTKIEVIWIMKNEVVEYAQEIRNILQRNGYEIVPLVFSTLILEPIGISIYDPENKLTSLEGAFKAAGISYSIAHVKAGASPYPSQLPAIIVGVSQN